MDSVFNEIFTHVLNSEVAELVSLPEFIYFNQRNNPISNTPEFMKLMLTLESVVKSCTHLVRASNIVEKRAAEALEQEREEVFGSGSDVENSSYVSSISTDLLDDGEDFVCDIGPDPNLELAKLERPDSPCDSSMTQSVFFKDKWGMTIKERINAVFIDYFNDSATTSLIASDIEKAFKLVDKEKRGSYVVYYSPLDCPYNVYYGTTCGSMFSFAKKPEYKFKPSLNMKHALLPGMDVDCAGYVIYGCSTVLTLAIKNGGVHQFTLDANLGMFIMTATNMCVPQKGKIYTINESSSLRWNQIVADYIDQRKKEQEQLAVCFCSDNEELNSNRREQDSSTNTLDTIGRWTTPMVRLLIKLYIDNKNNNSNVYGKRIWTNVAVSMQEKGYPVNPHQCSEKWRNLKKTYIKIRDTIGKTGSRRNKWEFYNKMEHALREHYNNSSASPIDNSNRYEEIIDNNCTDGNLEMSSAQTMNIPLELCKLEVYGHEDSSPLPASPLDNSPAVPEESSDQKNNNELNLTQENSLKRKSPPLEWYDKYLDELRAARHDRNKRHQDKQLFRQQLLDLCKQILISTTNNSKEMSS